jgi:peptide/nickel transport system substrate-binding protein
VLRFALSAARETHEVESGRADVFVDNIPRRLLPSVQTRYAAQLHAYVIPSTDFFQLNTTRRPFNDVRVRRALNLAIDRRTIARLYGGVALAAPSCQVLPPGDSGYSRYCPYTVNPRRGAYHGPDVARARRLVAASGTRGELVTVWGWTDDPTISESVVRYVGGVLRALGYHVRVRFVSHASLLNPTPVVFHSIQIIPTGWGDPSYGFFATYFTCGGTNAHGWFCDPAIDRLNTRARALQATSPHEAAALWEQIDRNLVNRAAVAPMINERGLAFVSARVTNYESHPYWGLIADQLSVR